MLRNQIPSDLQNYVLCRFNDCIWRPSFKKYPFCRIMLSAGYGGGMSSAKAALESDTRLLAFEAGRKYGVRVNTISAGPLGSRAAKAIGFIDDMIKCALLDVESPYQ